MSSRKSGSLSHSQSGSKKSSTTETDSAGRSRRKRTKTTRFDHDTLDNEEQILLQQALKISRRETKMVHLEIPDAPTFYPTAGEFRDTLAYINSIKAYAEPFGICKIVPPPEWKPTCQLSMTYKKKFPTKLQQINTLREGVGFDDGEDYDLAGFKRMADMFYAEWARKYYSGSVGSSPGGGGGGLPGEWREMTLQNLERDYWLMVETNNREAEVEYGNDLDTSVFGSGFPQTHQWETESTTGTPKIPAIQAKNSGRGVKPGAKRQSPRVNKASSSSSSSFSSSSSLNTFPIKGEGGLGERTVPTGSEAVSAAIKTAHNADGQQGHKSDDSSGDPLEEFDEDFYANSGWNINNIPSLEGSVLKYLRTPVNGVNVPWLYIGMLFSSFCWHNEDNYFSSINYSHFGAEKQWYGVPGAYARQFEKVSKDTLLGLFRESPDILHHMTTQISPSVLKSHHLPVYKLTQDPGTFVITFPKSYHAGFSYGFNCGEAVNFATVDWLKAGGEAEERYRLFGRGSVFSHQRLLFTLLKHQEDVAETHKKTLAAEIQVALDEEVSMRALIYKQGVRDISHLVQLPANNFDYIDLKEAEYDDMRCCCVCKHNCIFSAIACECDKNKVTCIRHFRAQCKCPKEKKFLLEWASTETLRELKEKAYQLCA